MSYYVYVCTQTAVGTDVEDIVGAGQKVGRENDTLLLDPMLDNMLLRMEEIEVSPLNFLLSNILKLYLYLNN